MATTNRLHDKEWTTADSCRVYGDAVSEAACYAAERALRVLRTLPESPMTLFGKPLYVDGQWVTHQELRENSWFRPFAPSPAASLFRSVRDRRLGIPMGLTERQNRKARRTAKARAAKERKR